MVKTSQKRVLYVRNLVAVLLAVFSIGTVLYTSFITPGQKALAATDSTINFQARLLTASGSIVPDGTYNIEFKLYNSSAPGGGHTEDQGACTYNGGTPDANCLWVETRTGGNQVTVKDGYLTVNLGSVTGFPAINWDQDLYLTMNVGGTGGSPSWDGEMSPRIHMTAIPYAFRAGSLANLSTGGYTSTLQFATGIGQNTVITLPDPGSGTATVCYQMASCGFVLGSGTAILQGGNTFSGTTAASIGTLNNGADDFLTNGTDKLNIDTSGNLQFQQASIINVAPASTGLQLTIKGGDANSGTNSGGNLLLEGGAGNSTGTPGSVVVQANTHDSTSAFEVQNAAGTNVFDVDTSNAQVNLGLPLSAPGTVTAMLAPTAPSVTPTGGTASTTYNYVVTAVSPYGAETYASATTQITNGEPLASLTGSIYNALTWTAVTGATEYKIYRYVGSSPTTWSFVGASFTNSFNDTGYSSGAQNLPQTSTGSLSANTYYYKVSALDNTGGQTILNTTAASATTTSSLKTVTLSWAPVAGARAYNVYRNTSNSFTSSLSYYTVYTNSFTDTGATATGTATPPTTSGAYANNLDNSANATLTVGNTGTGDGQLYVGGDAAPTQISSTTVGSLPLTTYVAGKYAYVVSYTANTLTILDISNPANPTIADVVSTNTNPWGVTVQGHYAYVDSSSGLTLQVFDVSNPENVTAVASVATNYQSANMYVSGHYLYVTVAIGTPGELEVYDITNPANPVLTSIVNTGGGSEGVFVQGRYAYVVSNASALLQVVDVGDPSNPTIVGSVYAGNARAVYVEGSYAYVVNSSGALLIYNISNPYNPVLVGTVATSGGNTFSVYVAGHYAYVTNNGTNMQIFDVTNPYAPVSVGTTTIGSGAGVLDDVVVSGRYAYVVDGNSQFEVFDLGGTYTQQLEAGDTETGTLQVDNNAQIYGDENLQGGLSVGQSIEASGNLGIQGGATIAGSSFMDGGDNQLATPGAPSVTPTGGTPAGDTYNYTITAVNASGGETTASPTGSTTNGYAVLSGTAYNALSWSAVSGATSYKIYRTVVIGGSPALTGLIGTSTTTSFNDTGLVSVDNTSPTTNSTGQLTVLGSSLYKTSTNTTNAFQIQNSSGSSLLNADTTNLRLSVDSTSAAMASPIISTSSTASGGGTLTNNTTYYYEITAVDANGGETAPSAQRSQLTGNSPATSTYTVTLTWAPIVGAAGYHIYRSTSSGVFTSVGYYSTIGTAIGGNLTYTDTGGTKNNTSATPPSTTTAYVATNIANTNNLELSVGGNGTPTGQLYVSGTLPSQALSSITTGTNTEPQSVFVQGNYAYVADNGSAHDAYEVYNISDPTSPVLVNTNTSGPNTAIAVQGHYLYAVNTSGGIASYDISNPQNTGFSSVLTYPNANFNTIYVQGHYAYLTDSTNYTLDIVDISNPNNMVKVSTLSLTNSPSSIFVSGNYAYIGGSTDFDVVNVSNPSNPSLVGQISGVGTMLGVYVQGNYAYGADYANNKFFIYDISNPANPVAISSVTPGTNPFGVFVQGRYAYITNAGSNTVQVFDVSNPVNPVSVGTFSTGSGSAPAGLYVDGRYAYVANSGNNTFGIFDLGGTYTQQLQAGGTETGTLQVDTNAQIYGDENLQGGLSVGQTIEDNGSLGVQGGATIAGSSYLDGGLNQLATPGAPTVSTAGSTGTKSWGYEIVAVNANGGTTPASAQGTTTGANGVTPLTSSNKQNLSWSAVSGATSYEIYRTLSAGTPSTLGLIGTTTGTTFSDTGLPGDSGTAPTSNTTAQLTVLGSSVFQTSTNTTNAFQIQNSNGTVLLNADTTNLRLGVSTTSTAMSTPTGFFASAPVSGGSLTLNEAFYYKVTAIDSAGGETAATAEACQKIASSGTNQEIGLIWSYVPGASGYKIYRSNTASGVACGTSNAEVYLTTVLNNTFTDTNAITPGTAAAPSTNTAYLSNNITNNEDQLSIGGNGTPTGQLYVSGSLPTSATGSVQLGASSTPYDFSIQGNYAYVTNANGFNVYNISNPADPILANITPLGAAMSAIAIQGHYAYVDITGNGLIYIYDISNPASPTLVSSSINFSGGSIRDLFVQGQYLYATDNNLFQLHIVNISNPANPVVVSNTTISTTAATNSVVVSGNYAYIGLQGVDPVIYNVSNPYNPTLTGTVGTAASPEYIRVQGSYLYVLDYYGTSMYIYNIANPASPQLVSTTTTGSTPTDVYIQGRYAYVVENGANDVHVYDVSNPYSPVSVGTISTGSGSGPFADWVNGRYLYVTDTTAGTFNAYDLGGTYTQQLQAGGTETGTLQVDQNAQIYGDENLQGALDVGDSIEADGNLGVQGGANIAGTSFMDGGLNQLATPAAPTVTPTGGSSNSKTWTYTITAVNANGGETVASQPGSTGAGYTTLTSTAYNHITWTAVSGATSYKIYRTATTGGDNPSTLGLVGTSSTNSFDDKAFGGAGNTSPTINSTGQLAVLGSSVFQTSSNTTNAFQIQNSSGSVVLNADTTNLRVGVDATYASLGVPGTPSINVPTQSATPTVTPTGGVNNGLTYKYQIVAVCSNGNSSASATGTTNAGDNFSSLSTTDYNAVSWTAYGGCIGSFLYYQIYRNIGGNNNGLIGTALTNSFNDTGLSAAGIVPTVGGGLTASSTYRYKITAYDATGGQTTVSSEVNATTGASANTTQTIDLTWTAVTGASYYGIYRTAAGGGANTEDYLTTVTGTSFTDVGSITLSGTAPPGSNTAYLSTNVSNNDLQLSVGGNGTPSGQLYVSGMVPSSPIASVNTGTGTSPSAVEVVGNYAYVGTNATDVYETYNISNPASPILVDTQTYGVAANSNGIDVEGHYLYDANSAFLSIYDISNPAASQYVTSYTFTGGYETSLAVEGHYAYVADSDTDQLHVIDISNPAKPVSVGNLSTGGSQPGYMAASGNYIYLALQSGGFQVISISNPANPVIVYNSGTFENVAEFFVQGNYLYAADQDNSSFDVIDISNPTSPTEISTIAAGTLPDFVYVQGRYAYVTDTTANKLYVIDVSNPAEPVNVGNISTGASTGPFADFVQGRYLYEVNQTGHTFNIYDLGGTYTQQLQAGGTETGTLQVDNNAQIYGDENLQGGLSVGATIETNGGLGVQGETTLAGNAFLDGGLNQLATPGAPTVSTAGSTGTKSWGYEIVAVNANGGTTPASAQGTTTGANGVTPLTSSNKQNLSWSAVSGATSYEIYRTLSAGTPSTLGLIGTTTGTTFSDTGLAGAGNTAPTINSSGQLAVLGSSVFQTSTNTTNAFQIQNSSGTTLLNADTTNMRLGIDNSFATMASPVISTSSTASTGGTLTHNTTYYYEITAVDANGGETTPSAQRTQATSASPTPNTYTITLTWAPIPGAAGYHIYRSTSSGVFTSVGYYSTIGTAGGGNLTYTDTNGTKNNTSATPPSTTNAYVATNIANTNNLELSVGGIGTPTGQLYVSGTLPSQALSSITTGTNTQPQSVWVQGNYAYVGDDGSAGDAYEVYNISDPTSPVLVNTNTTGPYTTIAVQGHYLYGVSGGGEMVSYDISNPQNTGFLSALTYTSANLNSIYIQGHYAYITDSTNFTLDIVDISNPNNMVKVSTLSLANSPSSIYVSGNYAYVGTSGAFDVVNVSNPSNPVLAGTSGGVGSMLGVYVQGNYAYGVDNSNNLLLIYDISNPASPLGVGSIATGTNPYNLVVQGRYAYVTNNNSNTVQVYDVSNAANPVSIGTFSTGSSSNPAGLYVDGRYIYVANSNNNTFSIFDLGGEYTQQLQAGGTETGTLQVDNNAQIYGDENLQGGLSVGQSIEANGSLSVNGGSTIAGSAILSGGLNQLATPGAPTVSTVGSTGAQTWGYKIVAVNATGGVTAASPQGTTGSANGVSTLTSSNKQSLSWTAVPGATSYEIYRTLVAVTSPNPSTTGLIGSTTGTTFTDTGLAGAGNTAPSSNTTAQLTVEGSAMIQSVSNSTSAFVVQNSSSQSEISVDTTNNAVVLGTASSFTSTLRFQSSSQSGFVGINGGASSSYTLTLPTSGPATGQCLQAGAVTATNLTFGSCSAAAVNATLQQAYIASAGASPSITVDSTNKAFTIQNNNSGGVSGGEIFGVHGKTGSGLGTGLLTVSDTGNSINLTTTNSTSAFQFQNAVGADIFNIDTTSTMANGNQLNYLTYPGFEVGSPPTGWTAVNGGGTTTLTQNTTKANTFFGQASAKAVSTSTNGGLTTSSFVSAPAGSLTYIVSFYAELNSGTLAANNFTVTTTGGAGTCSGSASTTVTATGFTRVFCSLAAGAGTITAFQITVASAQTVFYDGVQMQLNSFNGTTITTPTPYSDGGIQLRGIIQNPVEITPNGDSTNVLQVTSAAGATIFNVDTLNNQVTLGTGAGTAATVLVLGNKTDSGDPSGTCTSGAIYYNSNSSLFRACQNSTWIRLINAVTVNCYVTVSVSYGSCTAATTSSWSAPAGVSPTVVEVIAVGGGGGGGGGDSAVASTVKGGGGGGGGGAYAAAFYSFADITTPVTVTPGVGSAGGAAKGNGTSGTSSSFGSYLSVGGGGGGTGSTAAAGGISGGGGGTAASDTVTDAGAAPLGGTAGSSVGGGSGAGGGAATAAGGDAEYGGGGGSGGATGTTPTATNAGGSSLHGGGGGGGGIACSATNTTGAAGAGGKSNSYTAGGGGTAGTTSTGGTGPNGNTTGSGAGGGGGGTTATTCQNLGSNGGPGGIPGGGGGGGGAGTTGGTGGAGGAGVVWVISW